MNAASEEEPGEEPDALFSRGPAWDETARKFFSDMYLIFSAKSWFRPLAAGHGMALACLIICLIIPRGIGNLVTGSYQAEAVREMKFKDTALPEHHHLISAYPTECKMSPQFLAGFRIQPARDIMPKDVP